MIRVALVYAVAMLAAASAVAGTTTDRFLTGATAHAWTTPLVTWPPATKPGEWWNCQHSWSSYARTMTIALEVVPGGAPILWGYDIGGPPRCKNAEIAPAIDAAMSDQLGRLQAQLGALPDVSPPSEGDARHD